MNYRDLTADTLLPLAAVLETIATAKMSKGQNVGNTALSLIDALDKKKLAEQDRREKALERAATATERATASKRDDELLGLRKAADYREAEEYGTKKKTREDAITRSLSMPDLSEEDKLLIQLDPGEWAKQSPERRVNRASQDPGVINAINGIKDAKSYNAAKASIIGKYGAATASKILGSGAKTEMPMFERFSIYEGGVPGGPQGGHVVTSSGAARPIRLVDSKPAVHPGMGGAPSGDQLSKTGGVKVTKGQEAVDRDFGKDYSEYMAGGGYAEVQKNLADLRAVRDELKSGSNVTGPVTGGLPGFTRPLTNPKSVDMQERVESVAQKNLRLVLGGQFAQREGEQLIKRAYNPQLDESINAARLDKLIAQMETAAGAKQEAAEYFEQNGTLRGFDAAKIARSFGQTPTEAVQVLTAPRAPAQPGTSPHAPSQSAGPKPGDTKVNNAGVKVRWSGTRWELAQ